MENIRSPKSLTKSTNSQNAGENKISCSEAKNKESGAVKKKTKAVSEVAPVEGSSPKKKSGKSRVRKKKVKSEIEEKIDLSDRSQNGLGSSSSTSEVISNFSLKMNSTDNMRNTKQSRRTSLPVELREQPQSTPNKNTPDKKPSNFRSKTPECKNFTKPGVKKPSSVRKGIKFEPYIPLFQVQQGLKRGEFIEGALRINPRNYEDAYVNSPDGKMDIYIGGMQARNRALNGDHVCVQINQKQEWRVLCDAIKDYQEKSGEIIYETIAKSKTPSPCKIHTPDKLRSRAVSSNSWDSACGERMPDTVEILGVDKLAQQFSDIALGQRPNFKSCANKSSKSKEGSSESDKNVSSYIQSQGSSEDCLDKLSPLIGQIHHDLNNGIFQGNQRDNNSSNVPENYSTFSGFPSETYPPCDMNDIGTFNLEMQSDEASKSWEGDESGFNIIVSPEDLLSIDGNSLLNHDNHSWKCNDNHDNSDSEIGGIIVPPGELSGDEFTDSASVDSTHSQTLDQVIEDAAFLACQQDAENNNVENNMNPVTNFDLARISTTSNTSIVSRDKSLEMECKIQNIQNNPPLSYYEVNSDSVICSAVSETHVSKCLSSSDENLNQPVIEHHIGFSADAGTEVTSDIKKNKKSRHRRRPKRGKQKDQSASDITEDVQMNLSDLTVEQVMEHPLWPQFIQKTGKVVHVLQTKHSCIAAGHLKLCNDRNPKWALFSPNDSRVPRMMIPISDCPQNFYHRPTDYSKVLFLGQIVEWNETSTFASGRLIRTLGSTGDVEAQTEGMLVENSVEYGEFPIEVLNCLPEGEEWSIPANEIKGRKDFRKECVFTIDPATARDMDDAVSCEVLDNGNLAVGVHIADVTYFVEPDNDLDRFAQQRATSVYLVQRVVPMLPRKLCDDLCSLNPGKDRLTFSVVWEISPTGEILQHWIGRSIIKSCIKLSYEHAQSMIENPNKVWSSTEHPEIYGGFHINDVIKRVNQLNALAVKLREQRFSNGALRLDQVKLQFTLDSETGLPSGFNVYMQKDSNKLIEEFMLLANMTVGKKIHDTFPGLALLRRHPPPQAKPMQDVVSMCEAVGVILDASSSGALHDSIAYYKGDDYMSQAKYELLMHLCSKPMKPAAYFCTGVVSDPSSFHHYALNVPIYTHFTSPIRRYPDILVHRLLGASLRYNAPPLISAAEMEKCAQHCNEKKYNAKKVSEQSAELFLSAFISELGCVHAKGMVIGVMDHSFDCLILEMGLVKRVYCDGLPLVKKHFKRSHGVSMLNLFWKDPEKPEGIEQALVIFALVDVVLSAVKDTLHLNVTLKKPIQ
ncbi:DIS3-like exonuclease 2 [Parasteatoda tepidariorum]|uniref:DIS3-like exonuclease 2 n=1 Tax=Parasteatoda tepidariorum TaxID=114398 RepID=UPI00077FAB78|nr:DIS3-like exonuclease 2 [Parasteatoda tepidariorum]